MYLSLVRLGYIGHNWVGLDLLELVKLGCIDHSWFRLDLELVRIIGSFSLVIHFNDKRICYSHDSIKH